MPSEKQIKYWESMRGHGDRGTKESHARQGEKMKGNKWNIGRKLPEEQRKKIGDALRGEKSYLWKGGITPTYIKRRREAIKTNGGSHTFYEWENLKIQYNFTCPSCNRSEPEITLTKDHIIPVLRGGSSNIENIQPLCGLCNSRKRIKETKF